MIPTNLEAAAIEAKFAIQQALEKLSDKCRQNDFDADIELDKGTLTRPDGMEFSVYDVAITIKKEF